VASSLGRQIAQEVINEGAQFLLTSDGKSVIKSLLKVGCQTVLDLWLDQLEQCSRFCPVNEKVLIVVNNDHALEIEHWAGKRRFPTGNIIRNGALPLMPCPSIAQPIQSRST
jgi:hypothetical protein